MRSMKHVKKKFDKMTILQLTEGEGGGDWPTDLL